MDTMWSAIGDGEVDLVASDHHGCPEGSRDGDDFLAMPGGIAGCQHGYPSLMGEANLRAFGMQRVSDLASTNAAARLGIGHRKGRIEVGMDADLVLLSFSAEGEEIPAGGLAYAHPESPYVGYPTSCRVETTFCRGIEVGGEAVAGAAFTPEFIRPER